MGLGAIVAGYPKVADASLDLSAMVTDAIELLASTSSVPGLTYDSSAGQYVFVWKTDKSWAGTCKRVTFKLADGTFHYALFKFTK